MDRKLLDAAKKMVKLLNEIRVRDLSAWSSRAMEVLLETKPVIAEAESQLSVLRNKPYLPELLECLKIALDLAENKLIAFELYGFKSDADIAKKFKADIQKAEGGK